MTSNIGGVTLSAISIQAFRNEDVNDIEKANDSSEHSPVSTLHGVMAETLSKEIAKIVEEKRSSTEPIYIDFEEGDTRNPANYSKRKKWIITGMACLFSLYSGAGASTYSTGYASMIRDLNCTQFQATIGLALFALGFGVIPLVTASLSEEFGRHPLYLVSAVGYFFMYLMIAEAKNIQTVLIGRFLQGAFGSTGSTMVGGSIADIWEPAERGLPMGVFSLLVVAGVGIGPIATGWVEHNPHLEWRWIQWIQMIFFGVYLALMPILMSETRAGVILTRIVKKMRKETGDSRYRARIEDTRPSMKDLMIVSCTRAIRLLLLEPIVMSFSLWIGLAWGIYYCMIESIAPEFSTLHKFNIGEVGTTFTTMVIGSILGFISGFYQEYLYKRDYPTRGPEARLHLACIAAVGLPVGMLIYAWTSYPQIPWIAQMIGITIYIWATFLIFSVTFSYLADCYGPYASSALAGQSLLRNLAAMAFPLFTTQMFKALGYRWGNTLFGLVGVLMIPIPLGLFFYGPAIRRKSKIARLILESQEKN